MARVNGPCWRARVSTIVELTECGPSTRWKSREQERSGERGVQKEVWVVSGNFHRSRSAHMLCSPQRQKGTKKIKENKWKTDGQIYTHYASCTGAVWCMLADCWYRRLIMLSNIYCDQLHSPKGIPVRKNRAQSCVNRMVSQVNAFIILRRFRLSECRRNRSPRKRWMT